MEIRSQQPLLCLSNGNVSLIDVPIPEPKDYEVIIRSELSLISKGTEFSLVNFGRSSLVGKARQYPDRVRQVIDKSLTDGLRPTLEAVRHKLEDEIPLGYSAVGRVVALGPRVNRFRIGDRVVCNGAHGDYTIGVQNLTVKLPAEVASEDAVYAVVASIALNGIRLGDQSIGSHCAVIGLGLIGQIVLRLLNAMGIKAVGFDLKSELVERANRDGYLAYNADNFASHEDRFDCVYVAASSKSDNLLNDSVLMARSGGKLVIIGSCPIRANRDDLYRKQLSLVVSRAYGLGRYDRGYEDYGADISLEASRWSAGRNIEAVIALLDSKKLRLSDLTDYELHLHELPHIYSDKSDVSNSLGIIIRYDQGGDPAFDGKHLDQFEHYRNLRTISVAVGLSPNINVINATFVGCGNYVTKAIVPNMLKSGGFRPFAFVSRSGLTAAKCARRYDAAFASSNLSQAMIDSSDVFFVSTHHDSHAEYVLKLLANNKNIWCEKPLAITVEELHSIEKSILMCGDEAPALVVGFNRRFAPTSVALKKKIKLQQPFYLDYLINAGRLPPDSWVVDKKISGGRIVGECCHFIDLVLWLGGDRVISGWEVSKAPDGGALMVLLFNDGSRADIRYLEGLPRNLPKERITVIQDQKQIVLNNFKFLNSGTCGNLTGLFKSQDKGLRKMITAFYAALLEKQQLIPLSEIFLSTRVAIELQNEFDLQ